MLLLLGLLEIHSSFSPVPGTSGLELQQETAFDSDINHIPFPIEVLSPAPQGKFIQGQGKRKQKICNSHLLLTSTHNMDEVKEKYAPKIPHEKKKRQATKTLFDEVSDTEDY
ncbi:unnamed protein product [Diatraea saccharalis]|uniref:Uncharacterized protein n=1 Tax=Diatraea saccharalis TaxID=40085 RepID=A0A9N9R4A0_9NEOP|nr:unnamed protein product [Diatraea saccharalis]